MNWLNEVSGYCIKARRDGLPMWMCVSGDRNRSFVVCLSDATCRHRRISITQGDWVSLPASVGSSVVKTIDHRPCQHFKLFLIFYHFFIIFIIIFCLSFFVFSLFRPVSPHPRRNMCNTHTFLLLFFFLFRKCFF